MAQTSTIVVDESMMGLLIQLALHELMPKGFLLTRDADPMRMASSSSYDVWADEPWLRAIEAESAQTLLHFGSAHTSRAFKRRVPTEGDEGIAEAAPPVEDRFVCQVPGCAKVFASLPAYKYHMHHYEHDFEILLRCSRLLRRVFFAPLVPGEDLAPAAGPGAFLPERWVLRFSERQDLNRFQEGGGGGEAQFGRARRHICDRIMCLPDVVHILHGYIDQQLPLLFSFHFTKKRGAISLTSPSADFSITMRRDEDTVTLKRELVEMLTERRTRDVRRKPPPTTRTEDLGESSFGVSSFRDADAAFYQMSPRTISPADGSFALGGEGEIDASQRSHISLLCKFVVPAQLDRFQARRFVAAIGGIPPGKTATTTQPLAISPVPGGMPAAGSSSLTSLRPLPCAAMQPVQLRVLGLAPCSSEASTLSPDSKLVTPAPEVVASSEMIPLSGLHLSATDAVAYGDGFPLTSVDFFPGMAWQGEYGITWIAVGGNGAPTVSKFTVYLWALFLCFDSMAMGYRIASAPVLINAVSLGSGVDADDGRESSSEDLTDSDDGRGTVVAVKWCPFLFTTGATTAPAMGTMLASQDTRALMAVLDAVGAIFVFCLGMRSMLILVDTAVALMEEGGALPTPGTSDSGNLLTQAPLCRLAIPSYAITCFSWCKIPGQPLRIVAGTREGYIALFDLSSLREPVLVLMSPGHPTLISAIDWSMSDPNKVITASFDNTVVLWLLDNMYARTTLLQSRLPFLNASWMHSAHQAVGYQEKETPTGSLAWDPVGAVIAVDESNLAKIVLLPEPGRVITLASSTPRMWVGVYPNSRFGGTLLAMANWNGKVELFGTPDPRSKKGDSSNIASWSYNRETRAFSVYLPPVADDDIIASSVGMNDPMEWVQVSWHPIPIGLFAVVAATGLVHIHCS
ncbi:hypothetical protein DI09_1p640 [Mitosporidium daphniae]|uniref:C2H2-type domain-containing protein n=1 Tax=Mitosporidium daphniae TaxID=1485682 RepID=A0A098VTQ3_9MICR|nr:uncharacterized protein DI09_1p640 [Mitosporidium daphniae]KGG52214.1 hypothetical protein DI09_1p640 [Mitosporidium daphniae]|eukprot:XP_013238641.1 uncharacterized protein DI09_1p640 [Mitosporidium daphniae]